MMTGYPDASIPEAQSAPAPHRCRTYGVVARDGGWCVTLDSCATRPFPDREAALRIDAADPGDDDSPAMQ